MRCDRFSDLEGGLEQVWRPQSAGEFFSGELVQSRPPNAQHDQGQRNEVHRRFILAAAAAASSTCSAF